MAKMEPINYYDEKDEIDFDDERSKSELEFLFSKKKKYKIIKLEQDLTIPSSQRFFDNPYLNFETVDRDNIYSCENGEEALNHLQEIFEKGMENKNNPGEFINTYIVVSEDDNDKLVVEGYFEQNVNSGSNEISLVLDTKEKELKGDDFLNENLKANEKRPEDINIEKDEFAPEEKEKDAEIKEEGPNTKEKVENTFDNGYGHKMEEFESNDYRSIDIDDKDNYSNAAQKKLFDRKAKYTVIKLQKDLLVPNAERFLKNPKLNSEVIDKCYGLKDGDDFVNDMKAILEEGIHTENYTGPFSNTYLIVSQNEKGDMVVEGYYEQNVYSGHTDVSLTLNPPRTILEGDDFLKETIENRQAKIQPLKSEQEEMDEIFG